METLASTSAEQTKFINFFRINKLNSDLVSFVLGTGNRLRGFALHLTYISEESLTHIWAQWVK